MNDFNQDVDYNALEQGAGNPEESAQINDLHSLCESLRQEDESLVGETSLLWLTPDVIEEEDGFNLREYERPDTVAHILSLKEAWMNGTQLPPLEVKIENGRCFVRDGHCRLRAARMAIAEGAPIRRIPVIELSGSAEASSLRILTSNQQLKLTLMQRARGYKRLRDLGWSDQKIAKHIVKTDTHVRETIRLLTLPARLQELISQDVISSDMATKMFARYGDDAVQYIDEAYEKQKQIHEELLGKEPEKGQAKPSPIKVTTKHVAVPAPRITKKMVTTMSTSVRSIHDAFEGNAKVDADSRVVDLKLPLDLYEQFMAMAKSIKVVAPASPAS
ncbi:hypothetical protein ABGT16_04470 [Pseudomonas asiatica]|uniref:ParB/RepB/Spo0J family partition protein n=1 Tax=Pseudomonas TaxID=286 RepID=UPI001BAEFE91|nr:hypothetical protein [Pseudomonas putida]QUG93361.1 hypothetical protein GR140_31985 [Pseudomonas putida]